MGSAPLDASGLAASLALNGYTLQSVIGKGSQATIYQVMSTHYNRCFAAKVFHGGNRSYDALEIATLSSLEHPHVIRLYEAFKAEQWNMQRQVLIYEFCEGGSLMSEMEENADGLCRERVVDVGRQLVSALQACHAQRISHRDVKPENVLWRDQQRRCARLSDFGLSCAQEGGGKREKAGSPAFWPPEMQEERKRGEADPFAADVWALGMTLMEMVVGRKLWELDEPAERMKIARDALQRLRHSDRELEEALSALLVPLESRPQIEEVAGWEIFADHAAAPLPSLHRLPRTESDPAQCWTRAQIVLPGSNSGVVGPPGAKGVGVTLRRRSHCLPQLLARTMGSERPPVAEKC